jgi:hypothetical protein
VAQGRRRRWGVDGASRRSPLFSTEEMVARDDNDEMNDRITTTLFCGHRAPVWWVATPRWRWASADDAPTVTGGRRADTTQTADIRLLANPESIVRRPAVLHSHPRAIPSLARVPSRESRSHRSSKAPAASTGAAEFELVPMWARVCRCRYMAYKCGGVSCARFEWQAAAIRSAQEGKPHVCGSRARHATQQTAG